MTDVNALAVAGFVHGVSYWVIAVITVLVVRKIKTPFRRLFALIAGFFFVCAIYRFVDTFASWHHQAWLLTSLRFLAASIATVTATALLFSKESIISAIRNANQLEVHRRELQRQMKQLQESEERFRLLVQNVKDYAIYLLDADGRVASWNSGAEAMKGFTKDEVLGRSFTLFYPPDEQVAHPPLQDLREAADQGRKESDGWRIRKDGTRFWANTVITAIRNAEGELIGYAKITRDLTERRRAEEAIRQSQKFLDSMFENIPNMIFVKEARDLRFVRFNRAGEELLGYPRDEFIGKNDYDFFPKSQADAFTAADRRVLAGGRVVDIAEERIATRHQGERVLHTRKIPILDAEGHPRYLLGISEDITEQKKAEAESLRAVREQAALAERETAANRAAFLAEASTLLASSLDYHSNLKRLAELTVPILADWCSITAVNPDDSLERVAIVHADAAKAEIARELDAKYPVSSDRTSGIRRVIDTGKPLVAAEVTDEVLVRSAANDEHLALMRALGCHSCMIVPIISRERVHGAISFVSESPEHQFNSEDLQVAEELGRRAGIAIDNALLYEAAQSAITSRDEFLSIASHELKTPITALKLQLQVAQRATDSSKGLAPPPAKLEKIMSVSLIQVNRLTALIDDLLDVSRIGAGKLIFRFERMDLADLVSRMAERFDEHVKASGCSIQVRAPEPVYIWGDPFRIEQVILNLISNAAKYGNRKPIELRVVRDGAQAKLICRDHGIGIPEDRISHIFERYERAVHYHHISGLGLGLYISQEIVSAHSGTIRAESEINVGSVFTVEFPVHAESGLEPVSPGLSPAQEWSLEEPSRVPASLLSQQPV
jgi:PAS domain S-box-containing protein